MNPLQPNTPNPSTIYEFPPLLEDVVLTNNIFVAATFFPEAVNTPLTARVDIKQTQTGEVTLTIQSSIQERMEPTQELEERPTQQRGTGFHQYDLRPIQRRRT